MATIIRAPSRDWEQLFRAWAQAPSQTEIEKCARAERAIRTAITGDATLARYGLQTFAQGSYANRTNVRQDSDVDICVLNKNVCLTEYPLGVTQEQAGLVNSPYTYRQYKGEIGQALVTHFGSSHVTRGNKAFDVHENTYRLDADVVACFEFRQYHFDLSGVLRYHSGTALVE